jgi:hypothetical protein
MIRGRLGPDFAAHLRRWGLDVVEEPGWQTRGAGTLQARVLIAHHTGGPTASGDYPSLRVVRDGRSDLPGPLSQLGLGRSGTVYVIASGKANHAGPGGWAGFTQNVHAVGIEAENDGKQPWPVDQLRAYDRLCAATLAYMGEPAAHLCAHREWATPPGRKPDPHSIDMNRMRARVASLLAAQGREQDVMTPAQEKKLDDLARAVAVLTDEHRALRDRAKWLIATPQETGFPGAVQRIEAAVAEMREHLSDLAVATGTDPDALAAAVVDELHRRIAR